MFALTHISLFRALILPLLLALLAVGSFVMPVFAETTAKPAVGKIIFAVGNNEVVRAGLTLPVARGMDVYVGDRFNSGDNGHIHLLMIDQGFFSVRPNSRMSIDAYHYNPNLSDENQVKVTLETGVLRSLTGAAGQSNKKQFRLNTPVAAIGVRGTDFTVHTTGEFSRLSVRSGGVVMSPFGEGCLSSAIGPCEGQGALSMFATDSDAVLEARLGQKNSVINNAAPSPDEINPPLPQEQDLLNKVRPELGLFRRGNLQENAPDEVQDHLADTDADTAEASEEIDFAERREVFQNYLESQPLVELAVEVSQQQDGSPLSRDLGMVAEPAIIWGRWAEYAGNDSNYRTIAQLLYDDRRYAAINSVFGLLETKVDDRSIPKTGRTFFKLNSYEAYIKRGSNLEEAVLNNASLVIDFDEARFGTHLTLNADSLSESVSIVGSGEVGDDGFFSSDNGSPATIDGVFSPEADEAGYLFEYDLSPGVEPGVQAVGATHWFNPK